MDTRQEKREEETPVENGKKEEMKRAQGEGMPETMHCRRCKTLMENGVCPTCGFKVYVPMSKEKQNKIKVIATAVAMAVFIVIFIITQLIK